MGLNSYFFDSYALIEIFLKNQNFSKYLDAPIIITSLNQIEVTYYFLVHHGEEKAREVCSSLGKYIVELSNEDIIKALKFRNEHRKGISYADAIGYIYAKNNNLLFLTGDDAFKDMPNVEFLK
ncbi:MAG: PIN domain-containing protein [Nanoarchaeota archaeon]